MNNHTFVEPSRTATAAYLAEWVDGMRTRLRSSTWESYRMNIERHIAPHLGDIPLQNLTADAINGMYSKLLQRGRADGKGGLSPRSVRYVHTILRHALKDAVRRDLLIEIERERAKARQRAEEQRKELEIEIER